uniref:Uncharacterized protein n=1 Tax=Solanum lycopersicum TaxID=4081 RepID=A0A3Q7GC28_SOLLC
METPVEFYTRVLFHMETPVEFYTRCRNRQKNGGFFITWRHPWSFTPGDFLSKMIQKIQA